MKSNNDLDLDIIDRERDVLGAVEGFLRRYVRHPSDHALVAHALWIGHTHCIDRFHTTPRLAFMSEEKESGKTRALEVTEQLTPGALLSFSLSPAALVRKVAEGGHTVLYDEIDALFGNARREEGNLDLRSILNSGYKRGAKAYRCVTVAKRVEVEELDAFAPVALAGLKNLPDTLGSRAIIIRMRRRAPDETVEQFRIRHVAPAAEVLKNRLAEWVAGLDFKSDPQLPAGVTDRAAECWEPLLLLAEAAGGDWLKRAQKAALHFVSGGRDDAVSPGVELLEHIRDAFAVDAKDKLWTDALLQRLHNRAESPWKGVLGKPLDDRGLATRLRGFGIRSQDIKLDDKVKKGYRAADFADAWKRYLAPGSATVATSATSATSATILINQNKKVAEVAEVALSPTAQGDEDDPAEWSEARLNAEMPLATLPVSYRHKCIQCGDSGEIIEVPHRDFRGRVHARCADAWKADVDERSGPPEDDLDIPDFLDRRGQ